jgi:hypothetical protein
MILRLFMGSPSLPTAKQTSIKKDVRFTFEPHVFSSLEAVHQEILLCRPYFAEVTSPVLLRRFYFALFNKISLYIFVYFS